MQRPHARHRVVLALLLGVALFWGLDWLLFAWTGAYPRVLAPESYSGKVALQLRQEGSRPADPRRDILVLGDSRIGMGFSAKEANQLAAPVGLNFVSAPTEGGSLRVFYYLLRALDPDRDRYRAIVIPLLSYNDSDQYYTQGANSTHDRELDLRLLPLLVDWRDAPKLVTSFHDGALRRRCLGMVFFKGLQMQRDLFAFVSNPTLRRENIEAAEEKAATAYDYLGRGGTLTGLAFDASTGAIQWPHRETNDGIQRALRSYLTRPPIEYSGDREQYHRRWLQPLAQRYEGTNTVIILTVVPRAPLILEADRNQPRGGVPAELAREGLVALIGDEGRIQQLETPEHFFDQIHLNHVGRRVYSQLVADGVAGVLMKMGAIPRPGSAP